MWIYEVVFVHADSPRSKPHLTPIFEKPYTYVDDSDYECQFVTASTREIAMQAVEQSRRYMDVYIIEATLIREA